MNVTNHVITWLGLDNPGWLGVGTAVLTVIGVIFVISGVVEHLLPRPKARP